MIQCFGKQQQQHFAPVIFNPLAFLILLIICRPSHTLHGHIIGMSIIDMASIIGMNISISIRAKGQKQGFSTAILPGQIAAYIICLKTRQKIPFIYLSKV